MSRSTRFALLACALATLLVPATAGATITTRAIEYGPYTIPAGNGDPHDHDNMGMIANRIDSRVAMPCTDCKLIAVTPELVYTEGRKANIDTGPMLHHTLFAATGEGKADAMCSRAPVGILGERFFASGNERTAVDLTELSYGYYVGRSESWNQVVDLMNWATESKRVKIRITWKYATGSDATSRTNVRPVWFDADGCSTDSLISVPLGRSDTHTEISAPIGGRIIAIAGHIHDHGVNVELTNRSSGEASICSSVARYGETADYITPEGRRSVSSMNVCRGNPVATIRSRDRLRLHTNYDVPAEHEPIDDAMGIMLSYIAP